MFDKQRFLADLDTFVRFKTCVLQNRPEFDEARAWIKGFFDQDTIEFIELSYDGFTNLIVKPKESHRPKLLGDGHIEVVPAENELFELRCIDGKVYGRGVADMKTQCLAMMWVLRDLIDEGQHNDFWLLFSEDEEIGSPNGVQQVVDYLDDRRFLPDVVFVPDGGPDFAYVEKEKGILNFSAVIRGRAAHGSRPFLGVNAIERMNAFYTRLQARFPNPKNEADWVPSLTMTRIRAGEAFNKIPDTCQAVFDLRYTEETMAEEILAVIKSMGEPFEAEILVHEIGLATYYPKERPVAQEYINILRRISGKEPQILHSNGASNGRFYVTKKPEVQVLMSNPTVVGSHAQVECVLESSLEPYYNLVRATALL